MADAKPRAQKLPKSEITTVRLDPKLRYLAELAARKQRRSLSSFIEWAIEDALLRFSLKEENGQSATVIGEAERLWDVDAADRFVKLALKFPELLTHDEQVLWKLVRENGWLWRGTYSDINDEWTWTVRESSFVFPRFREKWDTFSQVAAGERPVVELPTWPKTRPAGTRPPAPPPKPPAKSASSFDEMDDDIPF